MEKPRILVIDDEKEFLDLARVRLRSEGYDVITAPDGDKGFREAKARKPDLVICDIRMPKKDGCQVLKDIREYISKDLPIIIISVIDDFEKIQEVYDSEADFYISKPVQFNALSKNIRTLLNLQKDKKREKKDGDV